MPTSTMPSRDEMMSTATAGIVAADKHLLGAVVIGRNEGERLKRCLDSVRRRIRAVVYVDSGSTDDSVQLARERGIEVVELNKATGYTAARARNAGFDRLTDLYPTLGFVQFIDGDCELQPDWLDHALPELSRLVGAAAVCGRRRERFPNRSPYNRLCDLEWDTPIGLAASCGGDVLMRAEAFREAGGFNPRLIAGEEPDLCHRLRCKGWTIHRLPHEMTLHDATMTRIGQWWQRNRRSGYATAEALALRGRSERRTLKQVVSNIFWASPIGWPLWPLLWLSVLLRRGAFYATFITIGKLPHLQGQFDYWTRKRQIIEYK